MRYNCLGYIVNTVDGLLLMVGKNTQIWGLSMV